jgi:hypothetical protein
LANSLEEKFACLRREWEVAKASLDEKAKDKELDAISHRKKVLYTELASTLPLCQQSLRPNGISWLLEQAFKWFEQDISAVGMCVAAGDSSAQARDAMARMMIIKGVLETIAPDTLADGTVKSMAIELHKQVLSLGGEAEEQQTSLAFATIMEAINAKTAHPSDADIVKLRETMARAKNSKDGGIPELLGGTYAKIKHHIVEKVSSQGDPSTAIALLKIFDKNPLLPDALGKTPDEVLAESFSFTAHAELLCSEDAAVHELQVGLEKGEETALAAVLEHFTTAADLFRNMQEAHSAMSPDFQKLATDRQVAHQEILGLGSKIHINRH